MMAIIVLMMMPLVELMELDAHVCMGGEAAVGGHSHIHIDMTAVQMPMPLSTRLSMLLVLVWMGDRGRDWDWDWAGEVKGAWALQ